MTDENDEDALPASRESEGTVPALPSSREMCIDDESGVIGCGLLRVRSFAAGRDPNSDLFSDVDEDFSDWDSHSAAILRATAERIRTEPALRRAMVDILAEAKWQQQEPSNTPLAQPGCDASDEPRNQ